MSKPKNYFEYDGEKYTLVKQYPNFGLYENKYGVKTCFSDLELGNLVEMVEPPKQDKNPEKVKL